MAELGLGKEYEKIMQDLSKLSGYEKNDYLDTIPIQVIEAQNILRKQKSDLECQRRLIIAKDREITKQERLFDSYREGS